MAEDASGGKSAGGPMQALTALRAGARARVKELAGGESFRGRAMSMGLIPGCEVQVVRGGGFGPVVVAVGGARLAVGHGMARRVMVVVLGEDK